MHSHSEASDDGQDIIGNPAAENNIRQGVTTVFASPDGFGSVRAFQKDQHRELLLFWRNRFGILAIKQEADKPALRAKAVARA